MSFIEEEFKKLVQNAFDFLEKSLSQLKTEPKYSVINFYSAIELFFKARLLMEHWSLIFDKPESASKTKFLAGDFNSVTLSEAIKRINGTSGGKENHSALYKTCFDFIRKHRNSLIHFYHADYASEGSTEIESIIIEQFQGWLILHHLFSEDWQEYFIEYEGRISSIDSSMLEHKDFLATKFEKLAKKVETMKGQQYKFLVCNRCSHESSYNVNETTYRCLVCNNIEEYYKFSCQSCNQSQENTDDGLSTFKLHSQDYPLAKFSCITCSTTISCLYYFCRDCEISFTCPEDEDAYCPQCEELYNHENLLEFHSVYKDYRPKEYGMVDEISCASCLDSDVIITNSDNYYCLNCKEIHESCEQCEWCGTTQLGSVPEASYVLGCEFCDGRGDKD